MKSWIKKVALESLELNSVPLFGNAPPLDWEAFSSKLESKFGLPHLRISLTKQEWKEPKEWEKELGAHVYSLPISAQPIGTVYWMISSEDRYQMSAWMMRPSHKGRTPLSEIFQEGFFRFVTLQSIDALQEMSPFQELSLSLAEDFSSLEKAFCIDLKIEIGEKSIWIRLAIPESFRSKWIEHFSNYPNDSISHSLAEKTFLSLRLHIGSIHFLSEEWEKIQPGDFIPLQGEEEAKSKGFLTLGSTPLFRAHIGEKSVEIQEYADYHEDTMSEQEDAPSSEEPIVSLKEAPLQISIELAKIQMSLSHLLRLSPGNTLDLPVHPEQAVSLTVGGKVIARAELVRLGEKLGLRILEI